MFKLVRILIWLQKWKPKDQNGYPWVYLWFLATKSFKFVYLDTQCYRGYQIGQDLCGCIQKSKGCVTLISIDRFIAFLGGKNHLLLISKILRMWISSKNNWFDNLSLKMRGSGTGCAAAHPLFAASFDKDHSFSKLLVCTLIF